MNTSDTIAEENKFGVTLLLLDCAFSAELRRDGLNDILTDIDSQLTEGGAPEDTETRVELMMQNASETSAMVANQEIEGTDGVADIAYSFIYCFGKTVGFDQVSNLRGLTGSFLRNVLSLNPCLGDLEYKQECESLERAMQQAENGDWEIEPTRPPTLH